MRHSPMKSLTDLEGKTEFPSLSEPVMEPCLRKAAEEVLACKAGRHHEVVWGSFESPRKAWVREQWHWDSTGEGFL